MGCMAFVIQEPVLSVQCAGKGGCNSAWARLRTNTAPIGEHTNSTQQHTERSCDRTTSPATLAVAKQRALL